MSVSASFAVTVWAGKTGDTAGSGNPAWYTLLGVAITATVTLTAVLVKHRLDLQAARVNLAQQLAVKHREQTQGVFASFLAGTAEIYRAIVEARRSRRQGEIDDDGYRRALSAVRPNECQVALEELRLITGDNVAKPADLLWTHLRSDRVPTGAELGSEEWTRWKDKYWQLRVELIEKLRGSLTTD